MSNMSNTIIIQDSFVSTGQATYLPIRSDIDWMSVYNYSEANATSGVATGVHGVEYFWQRGLAVNDGFVKLRNAGGTADFTTTSASLVVGGFTLIDSSLQLPGPILAYTAGTNATPPVITVASTASLNTGDIVRLTTSATAPNASGLDYSIEVLNGTTFSLRNMIAPGAVFGAGTYRLMAFNPIFYPRNRVISNMTAATQSVISTTVDHGFQVGDQVRLNVPSGFGSYSNLNGLQVVVVAVTAATGGTANTFTVNVDTTGFGVFAWPAVALVPFTPPQVEVIGYYTDATIVTVPPFPITNPNNVLDATVNRAFLGMRLAAGPTSPAGTAGQVIYWRAGKSFSTTIRPLLLADL